MGAVDREALKKEIEYLEDDIEVAEKYPTETTQFYNALARQRAELSRKRQIYESLSSVPIKEKKYPQRTNQQNKALHVLFQLLANTLNEAGLDMRATLKPDIEIPWSGPSVKEFLWRPIQQAQLQKKSTTELTTVEIDEVFDTINKHLGERFNLHVPFPSIEEIILRQEAAREAKKKK